ncbi:MAG: hypothetical protein NVS1B4_08850 [Gemmatimonadaceae bacterium]
MRLATRLRPARVVESHKLDIALTMFDGEPSNARHYVESSWTRRAGVDDQSVVSTQDQLPMGMSIYDYVRRIRGQKTLGRRAPEFVTVTHVNTDTRHLVLNGREKARIVPRICVAPHREHRRDERELIQHRVIADITCMENHVDTPERFVDTASEEPMCIRDQPNRRLHRRAHFESSVLSPHRRTRLWSTPT